jgi:hypothetical protein
MNAEKIRKRKMRRRKRKFGIKEEEASIKR